MSRRLATAARARGLTVPLTASFGALALLVALMFSVQVLSLRALEAAAPAADTTRTLVVAAADTVLTAVLLALLAVYVRRRVLRPVQRVALAADRLADGDLETRVPVGGLGEIARLGAAFNTMAAALAARERDLAVQTERLQAILDHATTTISVKDRDGRYLLVNDTWRHATGLAGTDVIGRTDDELFPPEIAAGIRLTDLAVRRGGDPTAYERDGHPHQYVKFPLKDALGEVYAIGTIGIDVSDRNAALEEAVAASRAKSEFLATVSHELRTPLNGVLGMTELLLRSDLTAQQREYAQTAADSGETLLGVIDAILDFANVEAGRLELDHHEFDLRDAIEDTCELLAPQARAKGIELLAWIDDTVPVRVSGDRVRLRQVLTNLLSNAIKFTDDGEVTVRVRREGGRVRFDVTDTGIGVSPAALGRLFDAFAQADASTTRRYGGTGLGLAIARRLVELMDGEIDAVSTPGLGSTFTFTVRLLELPAPAAAPRYELPAGLQVLVVDDADAGRALLQAYLGVPCATATSAPDALTAMHAAARAGRPFDLVVADADLPGMDGAELARAIELAPSLRAARVVLVTASARGDGYWVPKPVRRSRLLTTVSDALRGEAALVPGVDAAAEPTVLVVDDDPVTQRVLETLVRERGFAVETAVTGREALTLCGLRRYALVLMDCQLPELDGYAATAAIRAREPRGPRLPIVAITAYATTGDRERCLAAGMDDYLAKPVRAERLDAVLSRWVSGPEPSSDPFGRLVDAARMRAFHVDYPELVDELVELFVQSTPPLLAELRASAAGGDRDAVRRAAHTLRGASQNVGAAFLARLASDIEATGEAEPAALDGLERVFGDTCDALRAALVEP
ncbi:MAG TPA: response regulator [Solirubrobacter sp.]|nr:response regulator [Solirubrobacter sp.]